MGSSMLGWNSDRKCCPDDATNSEWAVVNCIATEHNHVKLREGNGGAKRAPLPNRSKENLMIMKLVSVWNVQMQIIKFYAR